MTLFEDARGRVPVAVYFETLRSRGEREPVAAMERIIELFEEKGHAAFGMPLTRQIDRRERIFEARPGDHQVAFIVHDGEIVLLHAWRKRSQRLDEEEAAVAVRRAREWRRDR